MFQSTVLSLVFLLVGLQQQPADGPTRIAKELIEATRANDLSDLTWALRIEKGNTLADAIKPLQTELMRLESDTPSAVWLLRRFVAINEIYRQHVLLPAEWERLLGRLRHLDKSILMNYKAVLDSSIKNAPGSSSEVSLSAIALALIRQSNLFDATWAWPVSFSSPCLLLLCQTKILASDHVGKV